MTLDDGFGHWLAGFADGEGCFYIRPVGRSFVCQFTIGLRPDDHAIIEEIHARTEIGYVRVVHGTGREGLGSQVRWEVNRKADTVSLLDIFDRYPLRAKKAADYVIWRAAVLEWSRCTVRRAGFDWSHLRALRDELRAGRKYVPA